MKLWLLKNTSYSDPEAEENYRKYSEIEDELKKKFLGKYVIIARGKFIGAYDTLSEVSDTIKKLNVRHAIVTKIGEEKWWGGSISL